ncbi:Predicted neuraminidase (sialidase) [Zunongwangia mangrovi]|uniref:Predicted neuraminidase (Sialidase) n=1 Tax=Zunongwangia mangrovi TaxID=1334022 RepID=A0A1I1J894_9FLAO|nr:exo-alpha-sialidase [Zunongwangia mangrovi]SFC44839.1 Predicted neuraminidase (sialidase) [Zunongwangia mangrovi]
MRTYQLLMVLIVAILSGSCQDQDRKNDMAKNEEIALEDKTWKEGIVSEEYIYKTAPYPSAHAATIEETTSGDLIAAWFGGTHERNPDVGIWVSKRTENGWTEGVEVANGVINDTLRYPSWNPVLYQVPDGDLLLFYKVGPHPSSWWGMIKRSSDGGETWSEAEELPEGYLGPIKNKPVLAKNDKLILPSSVEGNGWNLKMESTSDFGKTWNTTDTIPNGPEEIQAIQPSVLVHEDGRLQAVGRTKNRALFSTWSEDNGETWSEMELLSIPNNNSGTDAVTMDNGKHALIYNHVLPAGDNYKDKRSPLNLAISEDGINWEAALVLEDSKISQYSYPAIIQGSDGMLHAVYTWRRQRIKYVKIDPEKLVTFPIENGEWPGPVKERYKIGVSDWMIMKRQKLSAFELAQEIGADGIELDMGSLGDRDTFESKLGNPEEREKFLNKSDSTGVEIAAIAMSGFYAQSFAERPTVKQMVGDCVETMKNMNVPVAYLPLGVTNDLNKYPELRPEIIKRLRWAAEQVNEIDGVIAIETSLRASEERELLEEIGNQNIKISFNFSKAVENGWDISEELRTLGRDNIAQIHASTTDGEWLENNDKIDIPKIKETLDNIYWKGWLIVERSRDTSMVHDVKANYGANVKYLKGIFQEKEQE